MYRCIYMFIYIYVCIYDTCVCVCVSVCIELAIPNLCYIEPTKLNEAKGRRPARRATQHAAS